MRQRALRAAFAAEHGRTPNRTLWEKGRGSRSEWRRVKKAARRRAHPRTAALVAGAGYRDVRRARKAAARRQRRQNRTWPH